MEQPSLYHVYIRSHKQAIHYEGFDLLYTSYGRLGHQRKSCTHIPPVMKDKQSGKTPMVPTTESQWKIVEFRRSPSAKRESNISTKATASGKGNVSTPPYNASTPQELPLHKVTYSPLPSRTFSSVSETSSHGKHCADGEQPPEPGCVHVNELAATSATKLLVGDRAAWICFNVQPPYKWGTSTYIDSASCESSLDKNGRDEARTGCLHAPSLVCDPASIPAHTEQPGDFPFYPQPQQGLSPWIQQHTTTLSTVVSSMHVPTPLQAAPLQTQPVPANQEGTTDMVEETQATGPESVLLGQGTPACFLKLYSPELALSLTTPLNRKEVQDAIFSFKPLKAPCPDGLHPFFYQKYNSTVGESVVNLCTHIFTNYSIPEAINTTYLCLIPKVSGASTISQYRPISLCNTMYKIVTKIIVNRIKPLLLDIIGPTQASFLTNRRAADNAIVVQEVLDYFKHTKEKPPSDRSHTAFVNWLKVISQRQKHTPAGIPMETVLSFSLWVIWNHQNRVMFSSNFSLNPSPAAAISLATEFWFLLRQLGSLDLVYIDKEKNRLADSLARRAISTAHPSNISTSFAAWDAVTFWSPSPDLMDVLNADKRGDFTTRCVKTMEALPRSTSVHTPSNAMLGTTIG
ncbi:hypothetical protein FXO37_16869 [Capsicum annuum]|nr:hypothetical protein FXO37_16869 [Capsicum annuum]